MKNFLPALLLLTTSATIGQVRFETLQQCIDYSRQNNPQLKADKLNREVSHEKVRAAWAVLMPQLKAFGTLDDNISLPVSLIPAQILGGPAGEYTKVRFGTRYNSTYGAEASLSLVNVANWKSVNSAAQGEDIAHFQLQDRELTIREQLISAYYFALLSREAIALNEDLVHSGDSLVRAADVRLANGLIEPLEFNRVKSLYLESLQQLRLSQGAYAKNIGALKALCGLPESDSLVLSETLGQSVKEQHAPSILAVTSQQLPHYRMLVARASQAHNELGKQRGKIFPELSAYGRVSKQTFSNEFNFFGGSQPWYNVSVIGLRLDWNLFTGFNRQATIRQSALQARIADLELENYSRQSEKELLDLTVNHQVATEGLERFAEHFRINSANYRIAGEKYREGVYSIDQYVTIYQETVLSQNRYLNQLADYLIYESMIQSRNAIHE